MTPWRLRSTSPKDPSLTEPVWVDTITGGIYELPREKMIANGEKLVFKGVLVYDVPPLGDENLIAGQGRAF